MTEQERSAFIELEKLMNQKQILYYGAMKMRITGVDIRAGRMFIGMEEINGVSHDFDKKIADVPSFLSRIRLTPTVEESRKITFFGKEKRKAVNVKDYDVVSVWMDHAVPKMLVFSVPFSASEFLRKNNRLSLGWQEGDSKVIYLYPDAKNGFCVTRKAASRMGVSCQSFSEHIKHPSYLLELVMLNGKEALKLLPVV